MLTRVARSLTCNSGTLLITISVNGLCRVMWTSPCAMTFVNNRAHCVVSYFYTNSVAAHRRATLCIAPPWLATEAVRAVHLQSACSKEDVSAASQYPTATTDIPEPLRTSPPSSSPSLSPSSQQQASPRDTFPTMFPRLREFISTFNNSYVPVHYWCDKPLGQFVKSLRDAGVEGLDECQVEALRGVGFEFEVEQAELIWWTHYHTYLRYVDKYNTHTLPSTSWSAPWHGFRSTFTEWFWQQPVLYRAQLLPVYKVATLRQAGYDLTQYVAGCETMTDEEYSTAQGSNAPWQRQFQAMVVRLRAFREEFGDAIVPRRWYRDAQLGEWVFEMRTIPLDLLSVDQKTILADLGVPRRIDPRDSNWNKNFHELARYKDLFGDVNVPVKWKDARAKEHGFVVAFSAWVHQQLVLYKMGLLTPRQVDVVKLTQLGMPIAALAGYPQETDAQYAARHTKAAEKPAVDVEWEFMVGQLQQWKDEYLTCIVPRQPFDNPSLGEWVHKVRWLKKHKRLPAHKIMQLEGMGFRWKVDTATNNWHACFHVLRKHKAETGNADIPPDYASIDEAQLYQAAQWLARQRELYRKQKLDDVKLRLLKDVLGIKLKRPYAPNRMRKRDLLTDFAV